MNNSDKRKRATSSLKILVVAATLAAISIVMGKYLAISVGEFLRFSFENLPIFVAAMAFGPLTAALVGAVADLVGCLLVGYTINPIITLGAAALGAFAGVSYKLLSKLHAPYLVKIIVTVLVGHTVGSVIIKSIGLSAFYSIPLYELMLWRMLNYLVVATAEAIILYYLMKNKLLLSKINSIKGY